MASMLVLVMPASAKPGAPTIRIEGAKKTVLGSTPVSATGTVVKRGGHSCPGSSAAGALTRATHGHWSGKWFSGLGFEVFTIKRETDQFSTTHTYWELFVDNVAASAGMCSVKLHPGEHVLFAAVPANGTDYPLAINAPRTAAAGHAFTVKVRRFDAKGRAKPLAGAVVDGKRTARNGTVRITPAKTGTLIVRASKHGYIRDETTVKVS
jgi:hypothetical protein